MSPKSAGLAKKAGYTNIKVMLAGEPAWVKAGYPTYASAGFVDKGNIVLIDLRSVGKSEKARIPRSVSIPYGTPGDRTEDIPRKAPVVLYSDDEQESLDALMRDESCGCHFREEHQTPEGFSYLTSLKLVEIADPCYCAATKLNSFSDNTLL